MVVDVVVQNPQKINEYEYEKKKYVVIPRCAAAAVVSAAVLRRPTKGYTHRYSMMHRRLITAGIEVAPHYHQLLVYHVAIYMDTISPDQHVYGKCGNPSCQLTLGELGKLGGLSCLEPRHGPFSTCR